MINDVIKKNYVLGLETIFNRDIIISDLDKKIVDSNLYFGRSNYVADLKKYRNSILESDYFIILNHLDFSKLDVTDLDVLSRKDTVDDEVILLVKRTLAKVIKVEGKDFITYEFPTPDRVIKNGIFVLEFISGRNTLNLENDKYILNRIEQNKFIDKLILDIQKRIYDIFKLQCHVIRDKRI